MRVQVYRNRPEKGAQTAAEALVVDRPSLLALSSPENLRNSIRMGFDSSMLLQCGSWLKISGPNVDGTCRT